MKLFFYGWISVKIRAKVFSFQTTINQQVKLLPYSDLHILVTEEGNQLPLHQIPHLITQIIMKKAMFFTLLALSFLSTPMVGQDAMIGEVKMFAGNFAPRGWALCDGQLLPISSNSALFSILGTTYGGDGRTTFALPDLRGRAPIHAGNGPGLTSRRLGQKGGSEANTLTNANLPVHTHGVRAVNPPSKNVSVDEGAVESREAAKAVYAYPNVGQAARLNTNQSGQGQAVNNMQPYTVVNYIICLQGIFPSRN